MTARFADTFYFLALLSPEDAAHEQAMALSSESSTQLVTTAWVLTEVADALCDPPNRDLFVALLRFLRSQPAVEIIPASESLFDAGVLLYSRRPDKRWSLTDCISFVVMQEYSIAEALTGDNHFAQAGYIPLMC